MSLQQITKYIYGPLYENEELTIILEVLNIIKIDMLYLYIDISPPHAKNLIKKYCSVYDWQPLEDESFSCKIFLNFYDILYQSIPTSNDR